MNPKSMKLLVSGAGCNSNTGLKAILETVKNREAVQIALENLANDISMSVEELADNIEIIGGYPEFTYKIIEKLADQLDKSFYLSDIPALKKRIKHCKNPMEKKLLNRKLNDAYKEMRKK